MASSGQQQSAVDIIARQMAALALITGYGFLPKGQTEEQCKEKAKSEGGLAWDEHAKACWKVFGKEIKIEETQHSIQQGFEIVNFNFHVESSAAAVSSGSELNGPSSPGLTGDGINLTGA
jgi:hypothetical protein